MVCTRSSLLVVAVSLIILNSVCADYGKAHDKTIKVNGKDMTKKSIVFDKSTPDVFYCIPNKPTGEDKIIVRYDRWLNPIFVFISMMSPKALPKQFSIIYWFSIGHPELNHCTNYASSREIHCQMTTNLIAIKMLTSQTMRAKRNTE